MGCCSHRAYTQMESNRESVSDEQNRGMDKQYSGLGQGSQETATRVAKHTFGAED